MSFCANDCSLLLCRCRHQSKQNHKTWEFFYIIPGEEMTQVRISCLILALQENSLDVTRKCDYHYPPHFACLVFLPVSTPTFRIISSLSALHFYLFEGGLICNSLGHHLSFHLFQCSAWLVIDDKMELKDRPAGEMKTITLFAINKRWAVYSKNEIQYCCCVGWKKGV